MRSVLAGIVMLSLMAGPAMAQPPVSKADNPPPLVVARAQPRTLAELTTAAEQGDGDAANTIGGMYADGKGVRQDNAEAVRWYRRSGDLGSQWGLLNLGFNYSRGTLGLKTDEVEALRLYRLCAAKGNAFCQQNIGAMYNNGQAGLNKDPAEARRWYIMAADQGNPSAQYNIGLNYLRGNAAFPQSDTEAAVWFGKVVAQAKSWDRYPEPAVVRMVGQAFYRLALLEEAGRGVPQDAALARTHMVRAGELGIAEARTWLKVNGG